MDERFAVFISRKTAEGSFVCELGMQVSFFAAGKQGESELSTKNRKVIGKETEKNVSSD